MRSLPASVSLLFFPLSSPRSCFVWMRHSVALSRSARLGSALRTAPLIRHHSVCVCVCVADYRWRFGREREIGIGWRCAWREEPGLSCKKKKNIPSNKRAWLDPPLQEVTQTFHCASKRLQKGLLVWRRRWLRRGVFLGGCRWIRGGEWEGGWGEDVGSRACTVMLKWNTSHVLKIPEKPWGLI